jgi:hypothetical protein
MLVLVCFVNSLFRNTQTVFKFLGSRCSLAKVSRIKSLNEVRVHASLQLLALIIFCHKSCQETGSQKESRKEKLL